MKRHASFAAFTIVAMFAAACGHDSSSAPTSPTTPTPPPNPSATVLAVVVAATSTSSTTYQMSARADFSDNTSRDVTASARWDTSNASLATVTQAGVLTAVGSGQVDVRATFENVTGTMSVRVSVQPPPSGPTFAVFGSAMETAPSPKPLAGVTVTVVDGADTGMSAVTDAAGGYRL